MSYLGNDMPAPQGHPSAAINPPTTLPDSSQVIGVAHTIKSEIDDKSRNVTVIADSPSMRAAAATGAAVRRENNMLPAGGTNVMVRSGNQDGKQVGVRDGFVWGLQGTGDPEAPKSIPWGKLALLGVVGFLGWRWMTGKKLI